MSETVLRTQGLWRTYQQGDLQVHALRGVDLTIERGEFTVLAGPSGSGKSTLLNQLGALDTPTKGEVFVGDQRLAGMSKRDLADLRRDRIGFVFQAYNLVPVLTAFENAELICLLQGMPADERKRRVDELMDKVGLAGLGARFPRELSGGQQQRVAIVRALAPRPALVLADEPTANLDSETATALVSQMRALNEELGTTFVFSSHDAHVIDQAKRLVRLKDGQIEAEA
ncbi:MAG: ABC transporter ATP-binding protein [Deltaproteobacteria bacterium]|nr:MAG: ABC transporter ATP-binding protein [Deltaproteobacteria bacterium]